MIILSWIHNVHQACVCLSCLTNSGPHVNYNIEYFTCKGESHKLVSHIAGSPGHMEIKETEVKEGLIEDPFQFHGTLHSTPKVWISS